MEIATIEQENLAAIPVEDLRERLADAIGITAAAIRSVALIWTELERRGEDMSKWRFALRNYMRDVAAGTLLPETVAALAGQRRTLDVMAMLPPERQRAIIDGELIDIARPDGVVQKKPLGEMTFAEVNQTIRDGRVRSIDEQRLVVQRAEANVSARQKKMGRPVKIIVVDNGLNLRIGQATVPVENVLAALRAGGVL